MFKGRMKTATILLVALLCINLVTSLKLDTHTLPVSAKPEGNNVYYLQDYCFEFEVDEPQDDKLVRKRRDDTEAKDEDKVDPDKTEKPDKEDAVEKEKKINKKNKKSKHPAAIAPQTADKPELAPSTTSAPSTHSAPASTTASTTSETEKPKTTPVQTSEAPETLKSDPPAAGTSITPSSTVSTTPEPPKLIVILQKDDKATTTTTMAPTTTTTMAPKKEEEKEDKNPFANFKKFFGLDISRFMNMSTSVVGSQIDTQSKFANKSTQMKFFKKRSIDSSEEIDDDENWQSGEFDFHYFMDKAGKLVRKEMKTRQKLVEKQIKLQKKIARKYAKQLVNQARKHFKQIHLDPIQQPSIVIRSWRHTLGDGQTMFPERVNDFDLDQIEVRKSTTAQGKLLVKKCGILLRLPEDTQLTTSAGALDESLSGENKLNFGTVINLLDLK